MLKWLCIGLGAAAIAGGAYALYRYNMKKRNRKTVNIELIPQPEDKSPIQSEKEQIRLDEMKNKCWEKFKELSAAEYSSKCYANGFGGHGVLYYTQRLFGSVYIEKDETTENFVYLVKKIGNALNDMVYKLERADDGISSTKDGFFAANFAKVTKESVEEKLCELEEIIKKTVNSKNYVFYEKLYHNTSEMYGEVVNLAKRENLTSAEIREAVDGIKKTLENNNVMIKFVEDADLSKGSAEFIRNPDASEMPAFLRKDDGHILLQGSYCGGGDRVE